MQNGGKREGPIETYPKFWNWNPLTADWREILRIPAWKGSFERVKKELELTLENEILPTVVSEFPIVRRMILGMNSPLLVPSLDARASVEKQQKKFTDRIYSSSSLPHVRHQDKLMGNTRKEDEELNGSGHLENARASGSGEQAAGLERWKNDCGGKTHSLER